MSDTSTKTAIAIAAHPDDIEFMMAGTLLLLKKAGYEIHYMNLCSGNCGSLEHEVSETRMLRTKESRMAADILGAKYHSCIADDMELVYTPDLLRKVTATIRIVQPDIVLTHSPQDYMEDHMNACRLATSAAFSRGMPNFRVNPPTPPTQKETMVYHALPHGLRDGLRRKITAGAYADISSVHDQKRQSLAAHRSQKKWLDETQGMDSYLKAMDETSAEVGKMSGKFEQAEGWRRHSHLGFSAKDCDPLADALGNDYLVDQSYENGLG